MKRFTETRKWEDPWFRKLPAGAKLAFLYILDNCDSSGVWVEDQELGNFIIGMTIPWEKAIESFGDRVVRLENGALWLVKFIEFQYGKLSRECKPHIPVFNLLEKHGIDLESVIQTGNCGKNGVPQNLRQKVISRDGNICAYTGRKLLISEIVIDHVVPKSKGGKDVMENLVVSSIEANAEKSDLCLKDYCSKAKLNYEAILDGLNERLSKGYPKAIDSLQEKEEDKEKEKSKITKITKPTAAAESIYKEYPRKIGKGAAIKSIEKSLKSKTAEFLIERVKSFAITCNGKDPKFIPHPATWFNQERYDDEPDAEFKAEPVESKFQSEYQRTGMRPLND